MDSYLCKPVLSQPSLLPTSAPRCGGGRALPPLSLRLKPWEAQFFWGASEEEGGLPAERAGSCGGLRSSVGRSGNPNAFSYWASICRLAVCRVLGVPGRNRQHHSLSSKTYIYSVPVLSPGPAPKGCCAAGLSLSAMQPSWTPGQLVNAVIVQLPMGLFCFGRCWGYRSLV